MEFTKWIFLPFLKMGAFREEMFSSLSGFSLRQGKKYCTFRKALEASKQTSSMLSHSPILPHLPAKFESTVSLDVKAPPPSGQKRPEKELITINHSWKNQRNY